MNFFLSQDHLSNFIKKRTDFIPIIISCLAQSIYPDLFLNSNKFSFRIINYLICFVFIVSSIPLEEQIETCLDIEFKWASEEHLEKGLKLFDQRLPGKGNIKERYREWNNLNQFSKEKVGIIENIIEDVLLELRKRTKNLFDLPIAEEVEVSIVTEKNWGAANWYLGDFSSLMELNIDYPVDLFSLVTLLCHEIYPGHHVVML